MSTFIPLGPKRPIKKPRPYIVDCVGGFAFVDAEEGFNVGSEIFVCTVEEPAIYEYLEAGTYTLEDGTEFTVINDNDKAVISDIS